MKQLIFSIFILSFAGIVAYGFKSKSASGHKYTLTLTEEEWQSNFKYLESAKTVMARSSFPANEVAALSDSISKFESEINQQVGFQMRADTLKKK